MAEVSKTIAPVAKTERILALDVLRGFAIAGILIVNIQAFSMIEATYFNPTAYGDLTGLNKAVWLFTHVFADLKFMTIFSILFGAGIVLFSDRMETKKLKPAAFHYRRTIGLLILGLLHAYLLWYGDILVWYSLCALLVFLFFASWRAGGLMLIGMALYKWGVLTGERSGKFYFRLLAIGFVIGFPLIIFGAFRHFEANWPLDYSRFTGQLFNYWGSLGVSLGFISAIVLTCKSQAAKKITKSIAAVGRTALANYLVQTIICTTIFYGHGFGLFGEVERTSQILIVLLILIPQMIISPIWLRYFRFGPFEWLWRSFTYLKPQPVRVNAK
ncbi:MAG: DUF418 domain-containing protein [bacterium]